MTRWLLSAAALGTLTGLALAVFGPHAAIGVAVCALAVIVWFGVAAVRTDRRRNRGRTPIYPQWEMSVPPNGTIVFDHQPRDRSGMECGRCGGSTFFSHKCIDGAMVPGSFDGLVS